MTILRFTGAADALWRDFDALIVDLDGVVYLGSTAIEHAVDVLSLIQREGMPVFYATNNASHTAEQVAERISGLGLPTDPEQVITSSDACADFLESSVPPSANIRVVGADGIRARLANLGYQLALGDEEPERTCDVVVQGHSPTTTWRDLAAGFRSIIAGATWVATNLDMTIPLQQGLAPGNGAMVAALAEAAGRRPDIVIGKPYRPMFDSFTRRCSSVKPLIIGDRRDTDIAWANAVGCASLQVGTGVDPIDAVAVRPNLTPTYVAADLRGLLHPGVLGPRSA